MQERLLKEHKQKEKKYMGNSSIKNENQDILLGSNFHCETEEKVISYFCTDPEKGLSFLESQSRLQRDGENVLKGDDDVNALRIFLGCLINSMNGILLIALTLSCVVRDWFEASVIGVIIIGNTAISFIQEYRSEKTLEALRRLSSPIAKVIRDEKLIELPSPHVVVGDIIHLIEGDQVPADIRLIEAVNLEIDEAILTGENLPVIKNIMTLDEPDCPLGDRKNMAFKNTYVVKGRGYGVTVFTGMNTEVGKIARSVKSSGNVKTNLQKQLDYMMFFLLALAIVLAVVVLAVNKFDFRNHEVLLYAIAVSVAIIPEGLPAVITINMALGVRQIAKEKAIVRRMNALESLGEVTNICSDKTGTLTVGKMTVRKVWTFEGLYKVSGEGIEPEGKVTNCSDQIINKENISHIMRYIGLGSALCNTCSLQIKDGTWISTGDPTEVALLVMAYKLGFPKTKLLDNFKFQSEMPFDSTIKRMTVMYTDLSTAKTIYLCKGSTESILSCCTHYLNQNGEIIRLDNNLSNKVLKEMDNLAEEGLRVLSMSFKLMENFGHEFEISHRKEIENEMTFLGLVGMYDPPRGESKESVEKCYSAGITVHMATGDHISTASCIAKQIGIIRETEDNLIMMSKDFEHMSDEEIDKLKQLPRVLARCSPQSKVKLVEALHRRKKFVVMTGDGVNDAPAVKRADVGIAMGLAGSDVTKQASDIVLTDDNFATIVVAVAEGRRIFSNIGKFTLHLLTGNVAQVVCLIIGLVFIDSSGFSVFPMSPIQILWINLITSAPPALLLGLEKSSKNIMQVPPRKRSEGLFSKELLIDTFVYGFIMGVASLMVFYLSVLIHPNGVGFLTTNCNYDFENLDCYAIFQARGGTFASLYLMLLIHALNCKDTRLSLFQMNYKSNLKLTYTVILTVIVIVPLIYIPHLNTNIFKHEILTWHWGLVISANFLFIFISELYKFVKRKYIY